MGRPREISKGRAGTLDIINITHIYGRPMTGEDLLTMIWDALGDDRLTTSEATDRLEHLFGYRCPDDLAKTLAKLRKAGRVKGQVSVERGGWIWWADEECRSQEA